MRSLLAFLILFLALAVNLAGHDWPVKKYVATVHLITAGDQICTATKVGSNGIFLTMAHCAKTTATVSTDGTSLLLDTPQIAHFETGKPAEIIFRNDLADILVLSMPVGGPVLKVAKKEPEIGAMILALGYGNASFTAIPSHWMGFMGPPDDQPTLLTGSAVSGMSGGPVLNRDGEIVALVQGVIETPSAHVTVVVPLKVVAEAVKKFAR